MVKSTSDDMKNTKAVRITAKGKDRVHFKATKQNNLNS